MNTDIFIIPCSLLYNIITSKHISKAKKKENRKQVLGLSLTEFEQKVVFGKKSSLTGKNTKNDGVQNSSS